MKKWIPFVIAVLFIGSGSWLLISKTVLIPGRNNVQTPGDIVTPGDVITPADVQTPDEIETPDSITQAGKDTTAASTAAAQTTAASEGASTTKAEPSTTVAEESTTKRQSLIGKPTTTTTTAAAVTTAKDTSEKPVTEPSSTARGQTTTRKSASSGGGSSDTSKQTVTLSNDPKKHPYKFASQALLDEQYSLHAKEFGNPTKDQYLTYCNSLLLSTSTKIQKWAQGGKFLFYHPPTKEYAEVNSSGYITTYNSSEPPVFLPESNLSIKGLMGSDGSMICGVGTPYEGYNNYSAQQLHEMYGKLLSKDGLTDGERQVRYEVIVSFRSETKDYKSSDDAIMKKLYGNENITYAQYVQTNPAGYEQERLTSVIGTIAARTTAAETYSADSGDSAYVFIAPENGTKYHYSSACAGESAQRVPLAEVEGGYTPCEKCVS